MDKTSPAVLHCTIYKKAKPLAKKVKIARRLLDYLTFFVIMMH
ncbi:MAG: hypothetical protein ACJAYB_000529 [Psychromonas sp.]|jgi:hypothetical protein